ncbi:helix-turn-helix transcriptional regulator [Oceaniglobus trochenteri]|uniref:helix-turn-helix transcriptional regulator n=1 Tax=Oceaniglobus trochenteri TaxID=2763260 RepID=UPI001CFF6BBA|nr:AraC family transcriptional regulator [Oceaniglobus trochenteri]
MSHAVSVSHGEFGRATIYRLDRPIINHAHREGHIVYNIGGPAATMTVADSEVPCTATTATAISPWEPHSWNGSPEGEVVSLTLYIKPMWFLENSASAEYALKFGRSAITVTPVIDDLVKRLTAHLLEDEEHNGFDDLLFALTKESFEQTWHAAPQGSLNTACQRFSDFRVRRSLRLMEDRMTEDVDMEGIARSVGLSRPHFFKLFKQQMGVTPNIYLNTLRAEQAIEDLLTTDKSVTDIAHDLGFSSQASFTRFFSSNVGIAPSEYRRVAHCSSTAFPMIGQAGRLSGMPVSGVRN